MNRILLLFLAGIGIASIQSNALADWQADPADSRQVLAHAAVDKIKTKQPATSHYFDEAYGYVVWPTITRAGIGFGGAYGKGLVIEQDAVVGTSSFWQFTSGIQVGAKLFSMILFFKDKQTLDAFKKSETEFMAQAGIDFATVGAHGTPAYNQGVAIFALTKFGVMVEFTVSAAQLRFQPLSVHD